MTDLKDAAREVYAEYCNAIIAQDVDRWMAIWTDDAIQMAPNMSANIGKEKIRENNMRTFTLFDWEMECDLENVETREADGWGYAWGTYTFKRTNKETGEVVAGPGKYMDIFEKQDDGSWKIKRDCFNFNEVGMN